MLYSGEDDNLLRRAAAGGLAMLTSVRPSLCCRIPQVVSASSMLGRGGEPGPPGMVEVGWTSLRWDQCARQGSACCSVITLPCLLQTTHWLEILQALLLSSNQELQHRGAVVVLNMVEASREIASTLMESEVLEILSVLAKGKEGPVTRAAVACLGKAVEYGLIKPNQDGQ